jgi:hypothetical protein
MERGGGGAPRKFAYKLKCKPFKIISTDRLRVFRIVFHRY